MLSVAMFLCVMSYGAIAISNDKGTVAELITEYRTAADITDVFYQPNGDLLLSEVYAWDGEGLFSYLVSLDVERLSSGNEIHILGGQRLSVQIDHSGLIQLEISDRMIEVFRFYNGGSREYYYLRSEVDWDMITGFLDLDAERPPKTVSQDPQMLVYFDIAGQNDPLVALRSNFRAWDLETGETLQTSSNSDPASGLVSFDHAQARLAFDMPVMDVTVLVSGWDHTTKTSRIPEREEDCYSLVLEDYSAHYQVVVIYEPYDGVQYEATYVFDVKYLD